MSALGNDEGEDLLNQNFFCPISAQLMTDPVIDKDGISYERSAIEEWIQLKGTSPMTRSPLRLQDLTPNRALKDAIDSARSALPTQLPGGVVMNPNALEPPIAEAVVDPLSLHLYKVPVAYVDPESDSTDSYVMANVVCPDDTERIPTDIVVCIDVSGSMQRPASMPGMEDSGLDMLDMVKHAVRTIIEVLGDKDRLGIVTYSSSASKVMDLVVMNSSGKTQAKRLLDTVECSGMTNIWHGLQLCLDMLRERTAINIEGTLGNLRNSTIFCLTDGEPNVEPRKLISLFLSCFPGFTEFTELTYPPL
jgi:uncharacterized protein YegL